jgi:acyl-coenzyme A synthetase/AMP-(fatty) acid ligase
LNGCEGLKEAAVVAVQSDRFENSLICCAYSPSSENPITPVVLRKTLQKKLPSYMLPARWIVSEALPKNINGKIDRSLLKQWFQNGMDKGLPDTSPRFVEEGVNHGASWQSAAANPGNL